LVYHTFPLAARYFIAFFRVNYASGGLLMDARHPLVSVYHDTVLGFEPHAFARMNAQDSTKKYTKVYRNVTPSLLQSHLRGDITIATSLIDSDGQARAAALDIDEGGIGALTRLLERAELAGLTAFAITSTNEEHDGGHIWILFDEPTDPERLRTLAKMLAQNVKINAKDNAKNNATINAECYPTRKAIRLPLGVHTWTHQRGVLLFQGGE